MNEFKENITIAGIEYACEYNYSQGNSCELNRVYLNGRQMVGNGLPMNIFIELCNAIHALHMIQCAVMDDIEENEIDDANDSIINLTQHAASVEQILAGVVEPADKAAVQVAITFDTLPTVEEVKHRAALVAALADQSGCKRAMIGGAPFFMSALERALIKRGITPLYAFSVRESTEKDGVKTSVFRHAGWVGG